MLTALSYRNPTNDRQYLLEYGRDLFGNYVVRIRYGIRLGICKVYVFSAKSEQVEKVDEIKLKRHQKGYVLL